MRLRTELAASARLLPMFVLLAALPLAAVGWLGWQWFEQDRALEVQRRHDRLQNAANLLADALSRTSAATASSEIPRGVAWVFFDARGVIRRQGTSLPYYPKLSPPAEAPAHLFAAAEVAEFQQGNARLAAGQYRALARTDDPTIRAAALMRLARALRGDGKATEALAVYGDLAGLEGTTVAGAPAELVARRQRAALFDGLGDVAAAANERQKLVSILSEGRYALDRATFDLYREGLPAFPPSDLLRVVEEWWPRWHTQASGRSAWTDDETGFATVWTSSPEGTVAMVGSIAIDGLADRRSAIIRRNLLTAGFVLMTLVIVAAGYVVFRALNRELSVARLQSDFVAQVSHEFRTPLTAMRHLTELLEDGSAPPDRLPQYYQALGKETRRLHSMVESLLDFGRIESGRQVYRMEDTSLADVAQRVVSDVASPRIRLNIPLDAPRVRVDRDALTLAVQNLVDNAMKYSPESSPVDVSVEARAGKVGISIEDRGAGISAAEQRDVLKKFVRGSAARLLNVKGTGIGLAIADQVAKAHGGRLDVDSEPGRGSRFTIWVPSAEHG